MNTTPIIYVISGGTGQSGEYLARTVLAQFENVDVPMVIVPDVHSVDQVQQLVNEIKEKHGIVVHTLVDQHLRQGVKALLNNLHIANYDLVGQLIDKLEHSLHKPSLGKPGQYRKLREQYFKRIAAIEFAVDHDDGSRLHELPLADIVLTGVSRVGKTPLCMYLSTLGWKVANVPLIMGITPPEQLFLLDPNQVVGLTIDPGQLIYYRQKRQESLGISRRAEYVDPEKVYQEVEFAERVFRRGRFSKVNMTDRPIEEAAELIIGMVTRHAV